MKMVGSGSRLEAGTWFQLLPLISYFLNWKRKETINWKKKYGGKVG